MLELKFYQAGDQSIDLIFFFLRKSEAVHNKIIDALPNCKEQIERGEAGNCILYTGDDLGIVNVVMLHHYNMMICGKTNSESTGLIVDWIVNGNQRVEKVFGPTDLVDLFVSVLKKKSCLEYSIRMETDLMMLTALNPIKLSDGDFRKAEKKDMDRVFELVNEFFSEALKLPDPAKARERTESLIERENMFVLEWNKKIVCIAAITRSLTECLVISYVYTEKLHRAQGHATTCVGKLSRLILEEEGKYAVLFADKHNGRSLTSNATLRSV